MKKNKILPFAIVLLIVVIILLIVGKKKGWFGKDFTVEVATQKVESRTITEFITANGKIQPETEVTISPDVAGEIVDLPVKEGDEVKQGDLLCVIKPEIYISALKRAEASLNSSQARLAQAEAQRIEREMAYKRAKQLFEKGTIPIAEYESAEAAFRVAEAEVNAARFTVRSAEASVDEAREQLTKTKIYAPISGTISALNVEKGERVVGTSMMVGTEMMTVADLNRMEVQVEVNENDIVKVSKYDTALVEVDAYLGRKFKGIVTEIANSANTKGATADQVTNFDVKILLLEESYADLIDEANGNKYPFRPGMSATVDILTETHENVISVPIAAVATRTKANAQETPQTKTNNQDDEPTLKRDEKQEVVFVVKEGRARQTPVKTGIQDNSNIEILEGLNVGDEVVTAPYNAISRILKDSMMVKVVSEEELFKGKK